MNKKRIIRVLVILTILLVTKLYVGIYTDDEFGEKRIFIKYRPIWKSFFYSPRGMSDWELSEMPDNKKIEQKMFDDFILGRIIQ